MADFPTDFPQTTKIGRERLDKNMRTLEINKNKDGTYTFRISDDCGTRFCSEEYSDPAECCKDGMTLMNILHDENPVRTDERWG